VQIVLLSGVILAAAKFSALFLGRYLNLTPKNRGKFDALLARAVKFDERNGCKFNSAWF